MQFSVKISTFLKCNMNWLSQCSFFSSTHFIWEQNGSILKKKSNIRFFFGKKTYFYKPFLCFWLSWAPNGWWHQFGFRLFWFRSANLVQLSNPKYFVYGRLMTLDNSLSLEPNRCHYPLITYFWLKIDRKVVIEAVVQGLIMDL